jgi:hypothetical protein
MALALRSSLPHADIMSDFTANKMSGLIWLACVWAFLGLGATTWAQTFPDKIGVTLEGLSIGTRSKPFVDLVKTSNPWGQITGSGLAPIDERGWPTSDAVLGLFDIRPVPAWAPPIDDPDAFQADFSGTYNMSFHGQADLSFQDTGDQVQNQAFDKGKNLTTAQIVVPKGSGLLVVNFKNTKRTPSSPAGSGVTDVRVFRPGYALDSTAVFTDEFLKSLKPFAVIRCMDWLDTNENPGFYGDAGHHVLEWKNRHTPEDATQLPTAGKYGIAWEYVALLAKATDKDIWINIPVAASDDYVKQLAQLLKDTTPPICNIYIEHSNEVWNFAFPQYIYNKMATTDETTNGQSVLNNDGTKDAEVLAHRRHAKRLVEIGNTFRDVFGSDGAARIRPVYAWWILYPQVSSDVLGWIEKTYGTPSNYFYGLAGAGYFNIDGAAADASVDDLIKLMRANSDKMRQNQDALKQVADHYGIKLCQYEVGPDTGGGKTDNVANRIRANRDPRMKDLLVHDARDNWFAHGGDLYMFFNECNASSRYGSWGLSEDITNLNTPKWQAIYDLTGYSQ